MPVQVSHASSSTVCTQLLNTIRALSELSAENCLVLLQQMQHALVIDDLPMSESEMRAIIEYLNRLVTYSILNLDQLINKQFPGILFDKRDTKLARTMAIVFDNNEQEFQLIILTGGKFYNPVNFVTSKYIAEMAGHIIYKDKDSLSAVKKALQLRFANNQFVVAVKRCSKQCIASFKLAALKEKATIESINNRMSDAGNIDEVLRILQNLQEDVPSIDVNLVMSFIKVLNNSKLTDPLLLHVRPYIKISSRNGEYQLKLHSIANAKRPLSLKDFKLSRSIDQKISVSSDFTVCARFEAIINQIAQQIQQLHQQQIMHYYLRPEGVLLSADGQIALQYSPYSLNIESHRAETKRLLTMLGYSNTGAGYVDDSLIDPVDLQTALLFVEAFLNNIPQHLSSESEVAGAPTFASLNTRLGQLFKGLRVAKFDLFADFACAAPEVYYARKYTYNSDKKKQHAASIGKQVVGLLSKKAQKEIDVGVSLKHDIWAFGIVLLNILCPQMQKGFFSKALALVELNPALKGILEPDPELRITIDEFIQRRTIDPIIKVPTLDQITVLRQKYLDSLDAYNKKLEHIADLNYSLTRMVAQLEDEDLISNPDALSAYQSKVMQHIQSSIWLNVKRQAQIFFSLLCVLLDKTTHDNTLKVTQQLQQYIHDLLILTIDGLSISELELLLHKAIIGNTAIDTIQVLLNKFKTIDAWDNYGLWINDVNVWQSYLTSVAFDDLSKKKRMRLYIETFHIASDLIFKQVINSANNNLAVCVFGLIIDKNLYLDLGNDANIFNYLAANPDFCRVVNDVPELIMDRKYCKDARLWNEENLEKYALRSLSEVERLCTKAIKTAYSNHNVPYILLLMRQFKAYWKHNDAAKDWMQNIALNCRHTSDIDCLEQYLLGLEFTKLYPFQTQILCVIESRKSKSRVNSIDDFNADESKVAPITPSRKRKITLVSSL